MKITKTSDGWYETRISLTDPLTGQRRQPRVRGRTREELRQAVARLTVAHGQGSNLDAERLLFGELVAQWLAAYAQQNKSPNTIRGRRLAVELHIATHAIARVPLAKLKHAHVQAYADEKAQAYSADYVRELVTVLRMACRRGVKQGLLRENPCLHVDLPARTRRPHAIWSEADAVRFLAAIEDDPLKPAFLLALHMGMRQGEIIGLRWSDVDIAGGRVHVRRTLTRRAYTRADGTTGGRYEISEYGGKTVAAERTLLLPSVVTRALAEHEQRCRALPIASVFVFAGSDGSFIGPGKLTSAWYRARNRSGATRIRFHDLRHTAATYMLRARLPVATVAMILGHSDPSVTYRTYAGVIQEMLEESVDVLDRLYVAQ